VDVYPHQKIDHCDALPKVASLHDLSRIIITHHGALVNDPGSLSFFLELKAKSELGANVLDGEANQTYVEVDRCPARPQRVTPHASLTSTHPYIKNSRECTNR
jgi:hypothetical protein